MSLTSLCSFSRPTCARKCTVSETRSPAAAAAAAAAEGSMRLRDQAIVVQNYFAIVSKAPSEKRQP